MKKYIIDRWSSYESLSKDIAIIKFFLKHPNTKIRQKVLIEYFRDKMAPQTVRKHLYQLVKKRILEADFKFRGTYMFSQTGYENMAYDMDRLLRKIIGEDLYNIAISIYKKDKNQLIEEEHCD